MSKRHIRPALAAIAVLAVLAAGVVGGLAGTGQLAANRGGQPPPL